MSDLRFRFGPLETRGILFGLRAGQLGAVLGGAAIAVVCMSSLPLVVGCPLAVVVMTSGIALAFVEVAGCGLDEWLPVALRHTVQRLSGARRRLTRDHAAGQRRSAHSGSASVRTWPTHPLLGDLRIDVLADGPFGREMGVITDVRAGTSTALIAVRGGGFALLADHEKERRLASWAAALEHHCRTTSHTHRLQWLERSVAGSASVGAPDGAAAPSDDVRASYRQLLTEAAPSLQQHVVVLAVQMRWSRSARAIRAADRRDRRHGAAIVTGLEVEALVRRLGECGAQGCHPLSAAECALTIDERLGVTTSSIDTTAPTPTARLTQPAAVEVDWDRVLVDGMQHATYWVREWPRTDVGPDFLGPLLLQTAATRTVALTMAFEPPRHAQRETEAALVADLADDEVRQRAGFVSGFRRRREREEVVRRGEELAEGHGSVRFSAYVTVSAPVAGLLEVACGDVELRAQQSHLDIQRLYGQQDEALTYTLPLARGLR